MTNCTCWMCRLDAELKETRNTHWHGNMLHHYGPGYGMILEGGWFPVTEGDTSGGLKTVWWFNQHSWRIYATNRVGMIDTEERRLIVVLGLLVGVVNWRQEDEA